MTHTTVNVAPPVVRLAADRNIDKTITTARTRAMKERITVIIERSQTRRDGRVIAIPLIKVTPQGDVRELPPATLRTPIAAYLTEADLAVREGAMNRHATEGHRGFEQMVAQTADFFAARRPSKAAA